MKLIYCQEDHVQTPISAPRTAISPATLSLQTNTLTHKHTQTHTHSHTHTHTHTHTNIQMQTTHRPPFRPSGPLPAPRAHVCALPAAPVPSAAAATADASSHESSSGSCLGKYARRAHGRAGELLKQCVSFCICVQIRYLRSTLHRCQFVCITLIQISFAPCISEIVLLVATVWGTLLKGAGARDAQGCISF